MVGYIPNEEGACEVFGAHLITSYTEERVIARIITFAS